MGAAKLIYAFRFMTAKPSSRVNPVVKGSMVERKGEDGLKLCLCPESGKPETHMGRLQNPIPSLTDR